MKLSQPFIKKSQAQESFSVFFLKNKGFTLTEMLVYVAILAIVFSVVFYFLLWSTRANSKAKIMQEVLDNTRRAIEIMTSEIREAENIYYPTSALDQSPGQLSLQTTKYLPTKENTSYVDFYICEEHLCFKKESQEALVLTSDKVRITKLIFKQISTTTPSIQIDLKIEQKSNTARPETKAAIETTSISSLRSY